MNKVIITLQKDMGLESQIFLFGLVERYLVGMINLVHDGKSAGYL